MPSELVATSSPEIANSSDTVTCSSGEGPRRANHYFRSIRPLRKAILVSSWAILQKHSLAAGMRASAFQARESRAGGLWDPRGFPWHSLRMRGALFLCALALEFS